MNRKAKKSCTVPECILKFKEKRHFFRFPKEYNRWLQWVRTCGRLDLEPKGPKYANENIRMCHLHFEEKWYKINKMNACLHTDAIPTIFFEPHLKQQDDANEITQMEVQNVCKKEELHEIIQIEVEKNVSEEEEELHEITQIEVEKNVSEEEEELHEITEMKVEENVSKEEELHEITQMEVESVSEEEEEVHEITEMEVESVSEEEEEVHEITEMKVEENVSKEKEELHRGTSAKKPENVTSNTQKLLDDSPRKRKLHQRIKKLEVQNKTLHQTIQRLRMKEKIYKTIYKIIFK